MTQFWQGFSYWWRGWGMLWRSRTLGLFAILPVLFGVTFFVGTLYVTLLYLNTWTTALLGHFLPLSETWSKIVYYPVWLTFFILALIALIYLSYFVHILLCGPFYSFLADRTLKDLRKQPANSVIFSLRIYGAAALKASILLLLTLAILSFSFVPIVNIAGVILTLMILAFDTMDYTFDAMGFGFRERLIYFINHPAQWFGMTLSLALTLIVPGFTLLILPGAVVGAAMIFDRKPNDA